MSKTTPMTFADIQGVLNDAGAFLANTDPKRSAQLHGAAVALGELDKAGGGLLAVCEGLIVLVHAYAPDSAAFVSQARAAIDKAKP